MTIALYVVGFLWLLTIVALVFAIQVVVKFGKHLLNVETRIDSALDIVDGCYKRISDILSHPLSNDDPFVRKVVAEIKATRSAILTVAQLVEGDTKEGKK